MFPSTFGTVAMIVGAIWILQGLGIVGTGSFMDGREGWAVAGVLIALAGLVATLLERRRRERGDSAQSGS